VYLSKMELEAMKMPWASLVDSPGTLCDSNGDAVLVVNSALSPNMQANIKGLILHACNQQFERASAAPTNQQLSLVIGWRGLSIAISEIVGTSIGVGKVRWAAESSGLLIGQLVGRSLIFSAADVETVVKILREQKKIDKIKAVRRAHEAV